jgi:predicted helicase
MRHNLLGTFPRISVLDLHGSLKKREVCPDGRPDKNVFDIEPGVSVSFFLLTHALRSSLWMRVVPSADFYLFVPQSEDTKAEFSIYMSITDVFQSGSNGIQTSRDDIVYGFGPVECRHVIEEFREPETQLSTSTLRSKYWPGKKVANYESGDTRGWSVPDARERLRRDNLWDSRFRRALYRPFDFRSLFYTDYMIDWPRTEVMNQMLRPNLALCIGRAGSAADNQEWNIVFVSNTLVDMNLFYRGGNVSYPLRFRAASDSFAFDRTPQPNFKAPFLRHFAQTLCLMQRGEFGFPEGVTPEDVFYYIYAIFHSLDYRTRYAEFLKIDFPRVPLTSSLDLFRALAALGSELVALHLMESPALVQHITTYAGSAAPEVEKVSYANSAVWLDKAQTGGFRGVPEAVWNFHIGGYQVCEKWLKDRKGRTLSAEDIEHYQRVVVALNETIRIMGEIDELIEEHGGWPIQ